MGVFNVRGVEYYGEGIKHKTAALKRYQVLLHDVHNAAEVLTLAVLQEFLKMRF